MALTLVVLSSADGTDGTSVGPSRSGIGPTGHHIANFGKLIFNQNLSVDDRFIKISNIIL